MPPASLLRFTTHRSLFTMQQYRVLARKYRPQNFDDLIGQEVLVRTLTNAFSSGRIAHAFLLTGIRGIGKTTTARIIARGLNCIGPDGQNEEPTTSPCGVCPNCKMILEDRHVDVIEMDAASRTGVDDIREIIETVHYAPTSARYKVYIIDEVHMLSKNAFNALLKTLEEPPPHVKFIFATTELRKIPVTIISRCQRFDLRRIDTDMLAEHLINVAGKEGVTLTRECAMLIATAAEGSVRDSLSLLDQAIAMSVGAEGVIDIQFERLRDMLGLADKTQSFALLGHIFAGEMEQASALLHQMYKAGVDPALLLADLLDIVHYLTRIHVAPQLANTIQFSPEEQTLAQAMVAKLDMPTLARGWQMLLKGVDELRHAPNLLSALDMVLVRLGYSAQLPSPADIIKRIDSGAPLPTPPGGGGRAAVASTSAGASTQAVSTARMGDTQIATPTTTMSRGNLALAIQQSPAALVETAPAPLAAIDDFISLVSLMETRREPMLLSHLTHDLGLVRFTKNERGGHVDLHPVRHLPADVPARIQRRLKEWTGESWTVAFVEEKGEATLAEQRAAAKAKALAYAASHPRVQEVLSMFEGAEVTAFEETDKE